MYVLTDGSTTVVKYPYSFSQLRVDNPTVSFPSSMSNDELAVWNVFPVVPTPYPTYDPLYLKVEEGTPIYANAQWEQVWNVIELTTEEAAEVYDEAMINLRAERDKRLYVCDWTQLADAPLTPEEMQSWREYRQQLRDLPENTTDPLNPVWPQPPGSPEDSGPAKTAQPSVTT